MLLLQGSSPHLFHSPRQLMHHQITQPPHYQLPHHFRQLAHCPHQLKWPPPQLTHPLHQLPQCYLTHPPYHPTHLCVTLTVHNWTVMTLLMRQPSSLSWLLWSSCCSQPTSWCLWCVSSIEGRKRNRVLLRWNPSISVTQFLVLTTMQRPKEILSSSHLQQFQQCQTWHTWPTVFNWVIIPPINHSRRGLPRQGQDPWA